MSVKRVAQACNPIMSKRESVKAKIQKLQEEYAFYDKQVSALEAGIKNVTGFRVEELVKKVIEPGIDANGKPKKTTKWIHTSIVSYDAEKKQYVVTIPETSAPAEPVRVSQESVYENPATIVAQQEPEHDDSDLPWGSDFDIDKGIEPAGQDIF